MANELPKGFIAHDGGPCPVPLDSKPGVMFRDGKDGSGGSGCFASASDWMYLNCNLWRWVRHGPADIIAYRPIPITTPQKCRTMSYDERIEYETEILALEMRIERLKRLICVPSGNGGYTGDNYYPVGGSEASHEWDGKQWQWVDGL
jgi:hypothetical protein